MNFFKIVCGFLIFIFSSILHAETALEYFHAQAIQKKGSFPETFEELLELPGIGPYTAAAVASIAFNKNVAAIDGNVIRVTIDSTDHHFSADIMPKDTESELSVHLKNFTLPVGPG